MGRTDEELLNHRNALEGRGAARRAQLVAQQNVVTFLLFADEYECDFEGWTTDDPQ